MIKNLVQNKFKKRLTSEMLPSIRKHAVCLTQRETDQLEQLISDEASKQLCAITGSKSLTSMQSSSIKEVNSRTTQRLSQFPLQKEVKTYARKTKCSQPLTSRDS